MSRADLGMLGFSSAGLPIHAVCAITDVLWIITLYRPGSWPLDRVAGAQGGVNRWTAATSAGDE